MAMWPLTLTVNAKAFFLEGPMGDGLECDGCERRIPAGMAYDTCRNGWYCPECRSEEEEATPAATESVRIRWREFL